MAAGNGSVVRRVRDRILLKLLVYLLRRLDPGNRHLLSHKYFGMPNQQLPYHLMVTTLLCTIANYQRPYAPDCKVK